MRKPSFHKKKKAEKSSTITPEEEAKQWRSITDEQTNRVYYFNVETKEVTWDHPLGFVNRRDAEEIAPAVDDPVDDCDANDETVPIKVLPDVRLNDTRTTDDESIATTESEYELFPHKEQERRNMLERSMADPVAEEQEHIVTFEKKAQTESEKEITVADSTQVYNRIFCGIFGV